MENKVDQNITNNTSSQNELFIENFELFRKDYIFALLFCVSSIIFSVFGIWGGFKAGYSFSVWFILATVTAYFCNRSVKIQIFPLVCCILASVLALSFGITTNVSVRFFSALIIFIFSLIWFVSLNSNQQIADDYTLISTAVSPLIEGVIPNLPITLTSLFTDEDGKRKTMGRVLIGIAAALPVLFVVVPLLMSSDEAFSSLMSKLFGNLALTVIKIAMGIVIALLVTTYCFTLKKQPVEDIKKPKIKGLDNSVVISFLSVISMCYLMYLFSQLAYFFSAFRGILPNDYSFTVSEYARRGFFEMCVIAVINLIIISAVLIFARQKNGKICIASKIISVFICMFTLIIIGTALSKMFLYIKSFGMTELRITTSAFMLFLAVVFLGIIIRVLIGKIRIVCLSLITAGCILAVLGIINVNAVIAEYNYKAYKTGHLKQIDITEIYKVGDEGIPYLVKLADDENPSVAGEAQEKIKLAISGDSYYETKINSKEISELVYWQEYELLGKKHDGIGEYSLPKKKAYKYLDSYIEQNPQILKGEIIPFEAEY